MPTVTMKKVELTVEATVNQFYYGELLVSGFYMIPGETYRRQVQIKEARALDHLKFQPDC